MFEVKHYLLPFKQFRKLFNAVNNFKVNISNVEKIKKNLENLYVYRNLKSIKHELKKYIYRNHLQIFRTCIG